MACGQSNREKKWALLLEHTSALAYFVVYDRFPLKIPNVRSNSPYNFHKMKSSLAQFSFRSTPFQVVFNLMNSCRKFSKLTCACLKLPDFLREQSGANICYQIQLTVFMDKSGNIWCNGSL